MLLATEVEVYDGLPAHNYLADTAGRKVVGNVLIFTIDDFNP
jgi:hypothetical protein